MRFKAAPHWISGTIAILLLVGVTPLVTLMLLAMPWHVLLLTLLAIVLVLGTTAFFSPEAYELRDGKLIVIGRLGGRLHFLLRSGRVSPVPRLVGRLGASPFLGFVGWAWTADWSCIVMLASDPQRGIELETTRRPVVISPADTEAFKAGLAAMMSPPRAAPPLPVPRLPAAASRDSRGASAACSRGTSSTAGCA